MPLKAVEHAEDIFQSTLPREERLIFRFLVLLILLYFNPRSHERSDCVSTCSTCFSTTYFNPRSHERSDCSPCTTTNTSFISIHAPTRGATKTSYYRNLSYLLFQSTLPREERLILRRFLYQLKNFNPRSHERSDLTSFVKYFSLRNFNPRSHERSDAIPTIPTSKKLLFQSTLPREERQNFLLLLKFGIRYFNPRSHERSDGYDLSTGLYK